MLENLVPEHKLKQRLQIVFGRTNTLREVIDKAIQHDNEIRRNKCMRYLRPCKRFPSPEEMDSEETATWIGWIHQETQALLEDLNEEMRMQEDKDDPFTRGIVYATDNHRTSEISPKNRFEEKLASPLSNKKTNQPLMQQINDRRGEISPENREIRGTRGKPPAHNMRTNNTRCQITYDNAQWEGNDTSYLQLPNNRQG